MPYILSSCCNNSVRGTCSNISLATKDMYITCFENNVGPDQLASKKPADQDLHCFHFDCKYAYK